VSYLDLELETRAWAKKSWAKKVPSQFRCDWRHVPRAPF
jgi:hypothetical protein